MVSPAWPVFIANLARAPEKMVGGTLFLAKVPMDRKFLELEPATMNKQ